MRRTILASALLAAACATPKPAPTPVAAKPATAEPPVKTAAELSDRLGDSPETAVPVPADAPNDGIDFQNNWIYDRYGRFRRIKWAIGHAGEGAAERRYKIITFELPDHSEHTVYFDITENWLRWKPENH